MKAALLQAAMQGKLTKQSGEDCNVGIISSFTDYDGELLDIPYSWKWYSLNDVLSIRTGLSFKKDEQRNSATGDLRVLRGGNIGDNFDYCLKDDDVFVEMEVFKNKYIPLRKNDIIMPSVTSMQKMCKTAFVDKDLDGITAGGFVYIISVKDDVKLNSKYVQYFLSSPFNKSCCIPNIHKSGQAFYNLRKSGFITQPICVPPLAEQERIVEKLDKLLPLCDKLEVLYKEA